MSTILGPDGRPYAKSKPDTRRIGFVGTKRYRGLINEEYYRELIGVRRIDIYQRMRADGMVQAVLAAVRLPIMAASWTVEPGGKDANAKRARDLVEEQLFERLGECWESEVRELLNCLIYGFHVAVKNWRVEKGTVWLDELLPVHPRTILQGTRRWDLDAQNRVRGVWQYGTDGEVFREEYLPSEAIVHLVSDPEYRDPEGRSLLRGAYKHWYFKDALYRYDGIGAERAAVGTPFGRYPEGTPEQKQNEFYETLQGIVTDETGALMTEVGFELENFSLETKSHELHRSIQHHDTKIAQTVLAGFLTLGQEGNGGAYSLGVELTDLFLLSLESLADYIAAVLNRRVIPELVRYNIATDQYPKLAATVARQSASSLAAALRQLTAGTNPLIVPDEAIEDHIRELLQLPARTEPRTEHQAHVKANVQANKEPETGEPGDAESEDSAELSRRKRIELRVLADPDQFAELATYPALGEMAREFHAALVAQSRELQARVLRIAGLAGDPQLTRSAAGRKRLAGGRISRLNDDAGDLFTLTDEQLAAIDAAIEAFITELVGADLSEDGFAGTDSHDATIQHYERLAHAVGVVEARRLTGAEVAAFQPTRESPEIQALLRNAFRRLSEQGRLRLLDQLAEIKELLVEAMLGGLSPIQTARELEERFGRYERYEWQRLARTETAFAAVQGQIDEYKAEGVEELENLISALACPICQAFAGTRVPVQEAVPGVNVAPFHPNCLDSTIPVLSGT